MYLKESYKTSQTHTCAPTKASGCSVCAVRDVAVCSNLTQMIHEKFEHLMHHRRLFEGDTLFHEGDPRRYLYSVTRGALRLLKTLPDGRRFIAGFLLPGDFIGLTEGNLHNLTAEAIVECDLCTFEREEMEYFMKQNHEIKDRIFAMAQHALRMSYESQFMLGRFSPFEKVARFILDMNDRINGFDGENKPLILPMDRTDIADYLGLTVETVSRSFSKLKSQGLIALTNSKNITILNKNELAHIAAKM